jgi:hypothetical protein
MLMATMVRKNFGSERILTIEGPRAHAGNGLDVSAYRCVAVAGRNRQNCAASIVPVMAGCHPARAFNNMVVSIGFQHFGTRWRRQREMIGERTASEIVRGLRPERGADRHGVDNLTTRFVTNCDGTFPRTLIERFL